MNQLICVLADHENEGKLIEGICINKQCQATQKTWCVLCLSRHHVQCQRNYLLDKLQVLSKLKDLKFQIQNQRKKSGLEEFLAMKEFLNKELDRLQKIVFYGESDELIKSIERIISEPFTQQQWDQSYNLLTSESNKDNRQEIIKVNTGKMKKLLYEIEYDPLIQQQLRDCQEQQQLVAQRQQQNSIQIQVRQQGPQIQELIRQDWQITTNEEFKLTVSSKSIDCSPDCGYIAAGGYQYIDIFNPRQRKKECTIPLVGQWVWSVRYSRQGEVLATGCGHPTMNVNCNILIWDSRTHQQVSVLQGHMGAVLSLAFSPNGLHLASGSYDNTIKIWQWKQPSQLLQTLIGHTNIVSSVDYSIDGQHIVSSSYGNNIRIWNASDGRQMTQLSAHTDYVLSVKYSPDGQLIASASKDNTIRLWGTMNGQQVLVLNGHTDQINQIAFSPSTDLIASASYDRTIRLWSTSTGKEIGIIQRGVKPFENVVFSSDGKYIIFSISDQTEDKIMITNLNIVKPSKESSTCMMM